MNPVVNPCPTAQFHTFSGWVQYGSNRTSFLAFAAWCGAHVFYMAWVSPTPGIREYPS